MILEKTLKYSHKQKCSARKVSPPPPPPSPVITTKQTKPKKNETAEERGWNRPERISIPPKRVTFTDVRDGETIPTRTTSGRSVPKSNNNVSNNSVSNNSVSQPLSRSQMRINKMDALFKDAIKSM